MGTNVRKLFDVINVKECLLKGTRSAAACGRHRVCCVQWRCDVLNNLLTSFKLYQRIGCIQLWAGRWIWVSIGTVHCQRTVV